MKTLVVYYSRTGFTKKIGLDLAGRLKCDVEEVIDLKSRSGAVGYLTAGRDAMNGTLTDIKPPMKDIGGYDLVVVGTPVWAWTVSAPIRTYLSANKGRFKSVAFFCTMGGSGADGAFKAMGEACGCKPKSTVALKSAEVAGGKFADSVERFAVALKA
jgi:flavodoxin